MLNEKWAQYIKSKGADFVYMEALMSKPNIILITTDQQRFDTIHALGNHHIYTPHLNWLVDEGIAFTRCYSDSPVCMAARATVMTGTHGYTNGLTGNNNNVVPMRERPTLPGVLTANGYQTRAQGKMHFHPIRANYGFEHMELPLDFYRGMAGGAYSPKDHGVGENEIEPVISTVDEIHSATHWTVKRSIDFLETRDETRPFFLWTSFAKPHPPFDPCMNYWALYQNKILPAPVRGDWSARREDAPQGFFSSSYCLNNGYRMSEEQMMDVKRAYYACITQIDYSLGLLFARLREMELLENTWIIFTADHGDMMGDHGLTAKSVFFEGSAHIPMIIRPPAAPWNAAKLQGTRCDSLVTLADVMPTVLNIAGIGADAIAKSAGVIAKGAGSIAKGADVIAKGADDNVNSTGAIAKGGAEFGMDGINMLDLAGGAPPSGDRVFYGNTSDEYLAVMKDGVKYMWARRGGDELLFNLNADPKEQHDLSKARPELAAEMRQMLTEHVRGYNPSLIGADGGLAALPPIISPSDVMKWPGFHSTYFPSDVLH